MVDDRDCLGNISKIPTRDIVLGDDAVKHTTESDTLTVILKKQVMKNSNVIVVKNLKINLMSDSRLCKQVCVVTYENCECIVKKNHCTIFRGII